MSASKIASLFLYCDLKQFIFFRFSVSGAILFLFSIFLFDFFAGFLRVQPWLAGVVALAAPIPFNYLSQKFFVFRRSISYSGYVFAVIINFLFANFFFNAFELVLVNSVLAFISGCVLSLFVSFFVMKRLALDVHI